MRSSRPPVRRDRARRRSNRPVAALVTVRCEPEATASRSPGRSRRRRRPCKIGEREQQHRDLDDCRIAIVGQQRGTGDLAALAESDLEQFCAKCFPCGLNGLDGSVSGFYRRLGVAIVTDRNTPAYGPPLVNEKYSPLLNVNFQPVDTQIYTGLLNNRFTLVQSAGLRNGGLNLAMPNWATAVNNERAGGRRPPLVVVSSNRAGWVKRGLDAAAAKLAALHLPAFLSECDLRALIVPQGHSTSPPLYAPARIGPNRGVYIVVHMAEYDYYKTTLAGTGITPVGWQFQRLMGGPKGLELVGFGASRFAAMEFCKQLYSAALPNVGHPPWSRAWLIDDNVVAITAFPGFAAIEGAAAPNDAVSGFSGGTNAEDQKENKKWAQRELGAGRSGPQPLKLSRPPGVVQQAALWNIEDFAQDHRNFSPSYVASAEDVSIAKYFDDQNIPYKFYEGNTVVKELPSYDNKSGAGKVNLARAKLTGWFAAAESANPPVGTPPPPVNVQPIRAQDGGQQTLAAFVVLRVLPNSRLEQSAHQVPVQDVAKCHGVEQLTCGGIERGYAAGALANTFQINGAADQPVNRQNVP
jgi:hypothetical protein